MNENKARHKALINFLKQFDTYKNSRIIEKERNTSDLVNIDTNDINKAVMLICDFLNQPTGSGGNVDLYTLLQVYFTDKEKREKINAILSSAEALP